VKVLGGRCDAKSSNFVEVIGHVGLTRSCNSSSDPEVTDGVYPYASGPADGLCQDIVDDGVGYDKKPIVKVVASLLPVLLH
jgi:hypothetical protein